MENFEEDLISGSKKRVYVLIYFVIFIYCVIFSRLFYLQIMKGNFFYTTAIRNKLRKEIVLPPRGRIFDRNDKILVDNVPRFDLIYIPQYSEKGVLIALEELLFSEKNYFLNIYNKQNTQAKYLPVVLKKNLSFVEIAKVENHLLRLPGIFIQESQVRDYEVEEAFSSILGYVGLPSVKELEDDEILYNELTGKTGLEKYFNTQLKGVPQSIYSVVDSRGRKRVLDFEEEFLKNLKTTSLQEGQNLKLTLDKDLQIQAYNLLEGFAGGLIGIVPSSGEIIFSVSRPSFKGSSFSFGISHYDWKALVENKEKPMMNRIFQANYSPGSTFKPFVLIAGLENNIISGQTQENCTGSIQMKSRLFHCWLSYGHGLVNPVRSLRESCNNFYHRLSMKLNVNDIAYYAYSFGLGKKYNIGFSSESEGVVPTKEWKLSYVKKPWSLGDNLSLAIGQSYISTNLLQLALSYGVIATKGLLMKPFVVQEIFTKEGFSQKFYPEILEKVSLKESTWNIVRQGLYEVVNHPAGTVFKRRIPKIQASGKTGTTQVYSFSKDQIYQKCMYLEKSKRHHGLFVAYAPSVTDPKIVVAGVLEHSCSGSAVSPIVFQMIKAYLEKYESF